MHNAHALNALALYENCLLKYSFESFVFGLIVAGFLSRLQLAGQTVQEKEMKN